MVKANCLSDHVPIMSLTRLSLQFFLGLNPEMGVRISHSPQAICSVTYNTKSAISSLVEHKICNFRVGSSSLPLQTRSNYNMGE